ncbi:MAG: hypothetical protein KJ067_03365 [Vicinamibacteria bacterium]|nr:hypothetical protein [Vicinamibacteria bacterium]
MARIDDLRRRVQERLAEQRALVERLLALREQLPGSLFARFSECGKEGCVCQEGHKHGPYYVLSTRRAGKAAFAYLDEQGAAAAKELVDAHREFREGLKELKKVNDELVGLMKEYQAAAAESAGRRVGVAAAV